MSRVAVVMVCAALVSSLAGCAKADAAGNGHIDGTVVSAGGQDATSVPAEAVVAATSTEGSPAATFTVTTNDDGTFSLDLPAGTYDFSAVLSTGVVGGLTNPQELTVEAGESTTVHLEAIHP